MTAENDKKINEDLTKDDLGTSQLSGINKSRHLATKGANYQKF
jgi:hypothetical protein